MLPVQPLGIDQCNCFAMRKAARQISRFYDAHLEPTGLRITQFLTLAALSEVESAAVNALAERLDIERTAMGKMVGFLERDGMVAIEPSPTDGRSRLVKLTEAGRRSPGAFGVAIHGVTSASPRELAEFPTSVSATRWSKEDGGPREDRKATGFVTQFSMRVQAPPSRCRSDSVSPRPATGPQRPEAGINGGPWKPRSGYPA
jgi:MarR family